MITEMVFPLPDSTITVNVRSHPPLLSLILHIEIIKLALLSSRNSENMLKYDYFITIVRHIHKCET